MVAVNSATSLSITPSAHGFASLMSVSSFGSESRLKSRMSGGTGGGGSTVGDYYVASTGSDGNPGTSASPFRSIQRAADVAVKAAEDTMGMLALRGRAAYTGEHALDHYFILCRDR